MTDNKMTLLFIPDISGFTKFVNNTEIDHSQHIIAELLEIIINSDQNEMTVSEVEGDAVLFYKAEIPSTEKLIAQCEYTFKNFHSHLRRYDAERICRFGACESATKLSLKFIIHAGAVKKISVKDHEKLHGSDVILAHRLLKNSIEEHEYILITDGLFLESKIQEKEEQNKIHKGVDIYENVGDINYNYISLKKLHENLPEALPVTFPDLGQQKIKYENAISASLDKVYENFTNFEKRLEWNEDIKDIIIVGYELNQTGSVHRCLVGPYSLDIESLGRVENDNKINYGERLNKFKGLRDIISIYTFEKKGSQTVVKVEVDFKIKSFFGRLMKTMINKMLQKQTIDGLLKLKQASEKDEV